MRDIIAPFAYLKTMEKVKYCNNYVIPKLKRRNINWDMNTDRIIICGEKFPMSTIDNGKAEVFIDSLVKDGQSRLTMWR